MKGEEERGGKESRDTQNRRGEGTQKLKRGIEAENICDKRIKFQKDEYICIES